MEVLKKIFPWTLFIIGLILVVKDQLIAPFIILAFISSIAYWKRPIFNRKLWPAIGLMLFFVWYLLGMIYSENADNFKAYGVAGHRHHPEIVEALENISGLKEVFNHILFVPHLVPMIRGMLSTIYVDLTDAGEAADVQSLYEQFYANEAFVDVMPAGSSPETRSVRGANQLRIALYKPQPKKLVVISVQDNLVKGAAGQAVQNMNLMFGFTETAGLDGIGLLP
jgi:N-acetyl-gamma-glutamyl-phosphate reductase